MLCSDSTPPFVLGQDVFQTPDLPEPAARQPFRDPVFGACLVRVTDRIHDLASGDASEGMKNEYSRVQAFNADGSRLLVRTTEANAYLYDAGSLQPLGQLPLGTDPRWDAHDPGRIYYFTDTSLMAYDISSGSESPVRDFAPEFPSHSLAAVWTRYEGSPSTDGRYWGLMAEDQEWLTVGLLVYDQVEDRVTAKLEIAPAEIDAVTISPLGNYFLAYYDEYCEAGTPGSLEHPCGLMVYDRTLQNGRSLVRIIGHSDTVLDAQGREALLYQDIDADQISLLDLASGEVTPLWSIDFSHTPIGLHFSGRGSLLPGWAAISTHDGDPQAYTWMDDQVFAIELKPGGRIVHLAHTHSIYNEDIEHDYWAEPQVTANPDFTRLLFTTNWGRSGTAQVEMFMIALPNGWISQLP
jgi:hypothetical protein